MTRHYVRPPNGTLDDYYRWKEEKAYWDEFDRQQEMVERQQQRQRPSGMDRAAVQFTGGRKSLNLKKLPLVRPWQGYG